VRFLLRAVARVVAMLWALALALLGLGIALNCLDGVIRLGSVRPDRLLHLTSFRHHVGHFLTQVAAPGATAGLALLCGLGAILLGALLLAGLLAAPRERRAILDAGAEGRLAARTRALRDIARVLAEPADGITSVRRAKVKLSRRGTRGRLTLRAKRECDVPAAEVKDALEQRLRPLTEPFRLRTRLRVTLGGRGDRVP